MASQVINIAEDESGEGLEGRQERGDRESQDSKGRFRGTTQGADNDEDEEDTAQEGRRWWHLYFRVGV